MKYYRIFSVIMILLFPVLAKSYAENWPRFRGEQAAGVSETSQVPVQWDVNSGFNIKWKTAIPGLAHSSPIVWENRIFVSSVVSVDTAANLDLAHRGIGLADDSGKHSWILLALNKDSGEIIWERTAYTGKPRAGRHHWASQSNSTPVTDGKYIATIMGSEGLYCYDFDGNLLWKQDLGVLNPGLFDDRTSHWGYASSPIIYKDLVVVQCDKHDDSYMAAYNLRDGKEVWRKNRPDIPCWSTPVIYEGSDRTELIVNGGYYLGSFDPLNGKELWRFVDTAYVKVATPVILNDILYVSGGYPRGRPVTSLNPGANGSYSSENLKAADELVNWRTEKGGPYTLTPVIYKGYLYYSTDNGIVSCLDIKNGEEMFKARLSGIHSASPIAAGGYVYFASHDGVVNVMKADTTFELASTIEMGEPCMATPAISENTLFIRTINHLYAISAEN